MRLRRPRPSASRCGPAYWREEVPARGKRHGVGAGRVGHRRRCDRAIHRRACAYSAPGSTAPDPSRNVPTITPVAGSGRASATDAQRTRLQAMSFTSLSCDTQPLPSCLVRACPTAHGDADGRFFWPRDSCRGVNNDDERVTVAGGAKPTGSALDRQMTTEASHERVSWWPLRLPKRRTVFAGADPRVRTEVVNVSRPGAIAPSAG
jgi:hypothetical protein